MQRKITNSLRPDLDKHLIARFKYTSVGCRYEVHGREDPWNVIQQARRDYDLGRVILCQGRGEDEWHYQYAIPKAIPEKPAINLWRYTGSERFSRFRNL